MLPTPKIDSSMGLSVNKTKFLVQIFELKLVACHWVGRQWKKCCGRIMQPYTHSRTPYGLGLPYMLPFLRFTALTQYL